MSTLAFLPLTDSELIFMCVQYLIVCYEQLQDAGRVIVLLQYGWPFFRLKFKQMLSAPSFQQFKFPQFFEYIASECSL
jgi:hypothetical protein